MNYVLVIAGRSTKNVVVINRHSVGGQSVYKKKNAGRTPTPRDTLEVSYVETGVFKAF